MFDAMKIHRRNCLCFSNPYRAVFYVFVCTSPAETRVIASSRAYYDSTYTRRLASMYSQAMQDPVSKSMPSVPAAGFGFIIVRLENP